MNPHFRYAYLHGFASSAASKKGLALRERFARSGIELWLPDLNRPSFAKLSHRAMLAHLDAMDDLGDRDKSWRLIGSSLGGWVAARWAELRPARVDRLVLLCPGFRLAERWSERLGDAAIARWERDGSLVFPDATGAAVPVHHAFLKESWENMSDPQPSCPVLVFHGTRDEVVPVERSRRWSHDRPNVTLVEVDDDHALVRSLDVIDMETRRFFR